jgi:hypothetical protein
VMSSLGCLGWTLSALGLLLLLRRALGTWAALGVAVCVAAGCAGSSSWVALETNLVVAAGLGAIALAWDGRWSWAALCAGVACLLRPDAGLLALLLAAACVRREGRRAWRPALVFCAVILPWMIFAAATYGSVMPQTAARKLFAVDTASYAAHLLRLPAAQLLHLDAWPAVLLTWALFATGALVLIRRDRRLWLLPAYALLHFGAYLAMRPGMHFTWHLYPAVLLISAVALAALGALARHPHALLRGAGLLVLTVLAATYLARTARESTELPLAFWNGARHAAYRHMADYLVTHASPTDRVMAFEVGTLAYYSDLPMHDLGGLITRAPSHVPPDARWALVTPETESFFRDHRLAETCQFGAFAAKLYDVGNREQEVLVPLSR